MKEFFGVASSSSKSNSVGVGGLRDEEICVSDTLCREATKCRKDLRRRKTILTCALFPASPFPSRPPLPHPVQGRASAQAWGASEAEARSWAPASPLWPAAHRVFWFQQEEASSSWAPPFPRRCRESPSRRPFPRPASPLLRPRLRPTGARPSVRLLLLLHLHLRWRQRGFSKSELFAAPDRLKLFQLLVVSSPPAPFLGHNFLYPCYTVDCWILGWKTNVFITKILFVVCTNS